MKWKIKTIDDKVLYVYQVKYRYGNNPIDTGTEIILSLSL